MIFYFQLEQRSPKRLRIFVKDMEFSMDCKHLSVPHQEVEASNLFLLDLSLILFKESASFLLKLIIPTKEEIRLDFMVKL